MSQLYLISYDLSCDKLRKKCSDLCLNAGLKRVQLSVFCGALSYAKKGRLSKELTLLIDGKSESVGCVSIFPLPSNVCERLFCIHVPPPKRDVCHPVEALRDKTVDDFIL